MATPDCSEASATNATGPRSLLTPAFVRALGAQLAVGFGFSIYFLLPKFLATELHAGPSSIGNVMAISLGAAVVTTPLMGELLDRFGRRLPLAISGALVALASAGMLWVHEVDALLYSLRIVQGVGFALGFNAAAATVADIAPPGRLGQAMGLLGAASLLTNALAPALFEGVALRLGWKPVFAAATLMGLFSVLAACTLPRTSKLAFAPRAAAATDPQAQRVAFVGAINGAAFGALITFTQPFALAQGAERVSTYLVGYTLGALLVRVGLGNIADRVGRKRIAQFALASYGSVALFTAWLQPELLLLFGIGFGVSHGFLYPALAALAAEGASPERRGRALSNFNAAFNTGAGLAAFGGGWVARSLGYPTLFVLIGLITISSLLSFSAPAIPLALPPESKP